MDLVYNNSTTIEDLYAEIATLTADTTLVLMRLMLTDDISEPLLSKGYSLGTQDVAVSVVSYAGQQTTVVTTTERTFPTVTVIVDSSQ